MRYLGFFFYYTYIYITYKKCVFFSFRFFSFSFYVVDVLDFAKSNSLYTYIVICLIYTSSYTAIYRPLILIYVKLYRRWYLTLCTRILNTKDNIFPMSVPTVRYVSVIECLEPQPASSYTYRISILYWHRITCIRKLLNLETTNGRSM